ncbi:ethanolamine kinase 2 [Rhinatrema bivittatum]|uniref:ethanolamine kinase 2 n=1 Tax=Rhinatrema bivittatum TaxID=194408 RepID=UPI00112856B4|nr:ethanolamine kinase 2 [Rhinatrema bivittatum]
MERSRAMEEQVSDHSQLCMAGVGLALQCLNITVDEDNMLPGALQLIQQLRPDWDPQHIQTKLFSEGMTNKLLACYLDEQMEDALLIRIYGNKTELFVDHESEVKNFLLLQAHGCAPKLYCTFTNGLCYEFIQGMALGPEHVRESHIFRLIAQELARIHSIPAPNGHRPKASLWHKLHKYLSCIASEYSALNEDSPRLPQEVPNLQVLEEEVAWMEEQLSRLNSPVVLCHNDLLCKNMIYNQKKGYVRFIDYEFMDYNYQAFDIGSHFNEFAGVCEVDYSLFPSTELQLQWLRYYLQTYKQLRQEGGEVTNSELAALYVQVNLFALAAHFFWGFWALIQAKYSKIHFNFTRYAAVRFKQYFQMKPKVLALASETQPLCQQLPEMLLPPPSHIELGKDA